MFVKRLHEVNTTGGSIAADPVVLSLYQNLTAMQPQLLKQIDDIQQQKGDSLHTGSVVNIVLCIMYLQCSVGFCVKTTDKMFPAFTAVNSLSLSQAS